MANLQARRTMNNKKAFTLIELLVVVLIIGILAAVAVPQYQKAVEKSKATQAITLLKSVVQAMETYYMANGSYPTEFSQMDIDIPWTGNTKIMDYAAEAKSNGEWSIQIQNNDGWVNLFILRLNGKYKGAGFNWVFESNTSGMHKNELLCVERTTMANYLFDETLPAGSYCVRLFSGIQDVGSSGRYYLLP